jgi:hypothetical protein
MSSHAELFGSVVCHGIISPDDAPELFLLLYLSSHCIRASVGAGIKSDTAFTPGIYREAQLSSSISDPALAGTAHFTAEHDGRRKKPTTAAKDRIAIYFMKFPCSRRVDARQPIRGEVILVIYYDHKRFVDHQLFFLKTGGDD